MPSTSLDTADAVELAELLQFLGDWLATDHDQLSASLAHFVGSQAYGVETLRDDLARFAFLLGGNDGEGERGEQDAGLVVVEGGRTRAEPQIGTPSAVGSPAEVMRQIR